MLLDSNFQLFEDQPLQKSESIEDRPLKDTSRKTCILAYFFSQIQQRHNKSKKDIAVFDAHLTLKTKSNVERQINNCQIVSLPNTENYKKYFKRNCQPCEEIRSKQVCYKSTGKKQIRTY